MSDADVTSQLFTLLHDRYEDGKYVRIPEAPLGNLGGGYCDLIVMGVWGSTGNQIVGHEVKASRSDWLRELQQPEKSERFIPYCDYWIIVAPKGVVDPAELRSSWGLLEMSKNGKLLRFKRQPDRRLDRQPLGDNIMASWFRRLAQRDDAEIARTVRRQLDEYIAHNEAMAARQQGSLQKRYNDLKESVQRFQDVSGVRIGSWGSEDSAKAVKLLNGHSPAELVERYERIHAQLSAMSKLSGDVIDYFSKIEPKEKP